MYLRSTLIKIGMFEMFVDVKICFDLYFQNQTKFFFFQILNMHKEYIYIYYFNNDIYICAK